MKICYKPCQTARELKASIIRLVRFATKTHDNQLLNQLKEEIDQKLSLFGYLFSCFVICGNILNQLLSIRAYLEYEAYYVVAYQWIFTVLMLMIAKIPKRSNCSVFTLLTLVTIRNLIPLIDPFILKGMDSSHKKTVFFFQQCQIIPTISFFVAMLGCSEKVKFLFSTV